MCRIVRFSKSNKRLNLKVRKKTPGSEFVFARNCAKMHLGKFLSASGGCAIFIEPKLPTGYPDCVVVGYNPSVYDGWGAERRRLNDSDMKVLHHLVVHGSRSERKLSDSLGMPASMVVVALKRLEENCMVSRIAGRWRAKPIRSIFGIISITAFEVKTCLSRRVLAQADVNRAFAYESYVLVPSLRNADSAAEEYNHVGMAGFSEKGGFKMMRPKSGKTNLKKLSYIPWKFNEWIGRRLEWERRR